MGLTGTMCVNALSNLYELVKRFNLDGKGLSVRTRPMKTLDAFVKFKVC